MDAYASQLIAKSHSQDPNQTLMVMALIGQRLLDAHEFRQRKGLAKFVKPKAEGESSHRAWKLETRIKPEEVVFGVNIRNVGDLLAQPHSRHPGSPETYLEEAYVKCLMGYTSTLKDLNDYEAHNGLDITPFNAVSSPPKGGRPKNLPVERIEKAIGEEFSRIKDEFSKRMAVQGNMGRPGADLYTWWEKKARLVVPLRLEVLEADAKTTTPEDIVKRAIALNKKILQVAKTLVTNTRDELPKPIINNCDSYARSAFLANETLVELFKKISAGKMLSERELVFASTEMTTASSRRYMFYVDDVKARFPLPFANPQIENLFDPSRRATKDVMQEADLCP